MLFARMPPSEVPAPVRLAITSGSVRGGMAYGMWWGGVVIGDV